MTTDSSTRRSFIKASAVAATAASYHRVLGANDVIRLGCIGTGGRGKYLLKEMTKAGAVRWVAVCDVYSVRRDEAATLAGGVVKSYADHRRVLDHADIDA